MNYIEEKHGTVFLDPNRGFIQVREPYFVLKLALKRNPNRVLGTGHFADSLNDAKNNMPEACITPKDLEKLINIEEIGLRNISQAYQDEEGKWWCHTTRFCPTCGQRLTGREQ